MAILSDVPTRKSKRLRMMPFKVFVEDEDAIEPVSSSHSQLCQDRPELPKDIFYPDVQGAPRLRARAAIAKMLKLLKRVRKLIKIN